MRQGERLSDRYEILRELGRGGAGVTYLARDVAADLQVVAKLLHVGLLGDWKAVELFEREAAVLRQLHHEQIPAYVDFFSADLEGAPRFVLVREFVDGQSLQARVEQGWRGTEGEIRAIGARLLRVVRYIHSLRPPVIHRDINPRNIVVRPDGELFLLDFGGVQDAIRLSTGGASTIVGTPGYTPMEQFIGRASVRSDLYAVAATLLFLLTHRNPADLPVKEMRIDFASCIDLSSPELVEVLSCWLEPDEGKRTLPVDNAIAMLEGTVSPHGARGEGGAPSGALDHPPEGSRVRMTVEDGVARFLVPDQGGGWVRRSRGFMSVVGLVFVAIWFVQSNLLHTDVPYLFFLLPFAAGVAGMVGRAVSRSLGGLELTIGPEGLSYARRRAAGGKGRAVPLDSVGECRIESGGGAGGMPGRWGGTWWGGGMQWDGDEPWGGRRGRHHETRRMQSRALAIDVGSRTLRFGDGLPERDQEWLRDGINARLRKARELK